MSDDLRPAVWVGHVAMHATDPRRTHDFFVALGMTSVFCGDEISITELRGGTHLIIQAGSSSADDVAFDLMVDDLVAYRDDLMARGIDASEIIGDEIHLHFVVADPDGQRVVINNSHVIGPV
jgi:catechol 2,3-dioxygenase-like lactoylglutathione lyase family enzyme